jgi:hypothetical protein
VDRCALFVDAGYVLGDGAMAVHGTRNRESVSWDYAGVLQVLKDVAREHTGLPLLRCYWYEATVEGRSGEPNILADLPGVKLRLGRMRPGRREGVESEIHRDLTALARNKAISDALVVSADEDLAQVIADVQDLGIRVVLVHIGGPGWTAPPALHQECDDIVEIGAAHLRPSVELVFGAEPVSEEERQAAYQSRTPANGHGRPGVIGQPQARPAGSHAAPPTIYTGAEIAEYQRAAQPASSPPPAAANAYGPLGAGQPRSGENRVAGLAPGGPGMAAPPPPAPPPPAPRPPAPPPPAPRPPIPSQGIATPPSPAPAGTPYSRDIGDYPTLPPHPGVAAQMGTVGSQQGPPPPGQLPPSQTPAPVPPPAPQRTRISGQHAGLPSPQASSAPTISGHHAPHPLPQQFAPGQSAPPGQPAPPRGQPVPGQPAPPPAHAVPPPGQAMPAYQAAPPPPSTPPAAPAQPGFRGQAPDVAAARQAAATPRPPTVGAPPGPPLGAPPSAAPAGPLVQPGQPGQQPRGYPADMPGRAPSGPTDQQARQFPVAPPHPDARTTTPYVPQPGAMAPADAVQAAHREGFSFGQAVARDAPALWLEAVLARKPRMPSDLEARLLQDSSLPIDSLLHDEVRHALRRGFWDALERVRH